MKTNEKITKELGFAILEAAGWEKGYYGDSLISLIKKRTDQLMFANGHQEI